MNQIEALKTIENILAEKRQKYGQGDQKSADEAYFGCIEALISISQMPDCNTPYVLSAIKNAIQSFREHVDLGIIVRGKFSPISPALAACRNLVSGSLASSKFLILKKDEADRVLLDPIGAEWPHDSFWDTKSESLVSKPYWYRLHPHQVLSLSKKDREDMNLDELYIETLLKLKKRVS